MCHMGQICDIFWVGKLHTTCCTARIGPWWFLTVRGNKEFAVYDCICHQDSKGVMLSPSTKYVHIKSTTVYAPRRNWDSPNPFLARGGGTLACGWGVGGSPISDEGHTLWYSLYVRTLCLPPSAPSPLLNAYGQGWAKLVLIALERYSVELKRLTFNLR